MFVAENLNKIPSIKASHSDTYVLVFKMYDLKVVVDQLGVHVSD